RPSTTTFFMDRFRLPTAEPQHLAARLGAGILELEPLAPHQQQGEDVAEVDAGRLVLSFQMSEAVQQQVVVDGRATVLLAGGHLAAPEAECAIRRSLPDLTAVLAPDEAAVFIKEDTEVRLAGLQLTATDTAAAAVGLELIVA